MIQDLWMFIGSVWFYSHNFILPAQATIPIFLKIIGYKREEVGEETILKIKD